jgi:hypothetical protein
MAWLDLFMRTGHDASARGPFTPAHFLCPEHTPGRNARPTAAGQAAFAVVLPGTETADGLRQIGQCLLGWQLENPRVGEIVGLQQLLTGQPPVTLDWHFGGTVSLYPARVALVYVDAEAANESTGRELEACLRDCSIGMVVSPEYWTHIWR